MIIVNHAADSKVICNGCMMLVLLVHAGVVKLKKQFEQFFLFNKVPFDLIVCQFQRQEH